MPLNAVKLAPPPTKFAAVITPDTASIPVELIVTADPTVATPITFISVSYTHLTLPTNREV